MYTFMRKPGEMLPIYRLKDLIIDLEKRLSLQIRQHNVRIIYFSIDCEQLWSHGCCINYLYNQCLSPLELWVRIPLVARLQHYVIKFVSFLRVLQFPPPILAEKIMKTVKLPILYSPLQKITASYCMIGHTCLVWLIGLGLGL
jgi:hypothetical protein